MKHQTALLRLATGAALSISVMANLKAWLKRPTKSPEPDMPDQPVEQLPPVQIKSLDLTGLCVVVRRADGRLIAASDGRIVLTGDEAEVVCDAYCLGDITPTHPSGAYWNFDVGPRAQHNGGTHQYRLFMRWPEQVGHITSYISLGCYEGETQLHFGPWNGNAAANPQETFWSTDPALQVRLNELATGMMLGQEVKELIRELGEELREPLPDRT